VLNNLIDINVSIYPNPSLGVVNIETELDFTKVNIYQQDGKLIKTSKNRKFYLPSNSMYFIKIFTSSGNAIKKLIVQ
jgi:hypothetical protein